MSSKWSDIAAQLNAAYILLQQRASLAEKHDDISDIERSKRRAYSAAVAQSHGLWKQSATALNDASAKTILDLGIDRYTATINAGQAMGIPLSFPPPPQRYVPLPVTMVESKPKTPSGGSGGYMPGPQTQPGSGWPTAPGGSTGPSEAGSSGLLMLGAAAVAVAFFMSKKKGG